MCPHLTDVKVYPVAVILCLYNLWCVVSYIKDSIDRVFKNRLLRIFGPKGDEVMGEWRKLHSGELNLYSSPDTIRQVKLRRMGWAGHVTRMGAGRKVCKVLVGKTKGNRPFDRPRRRWGGGVLGLEWILERLARSVRSGFT
jgi:hypothetical protein